MKPPSEQLPVYSLQSFSSPERKSQQFQVEVFDANRHFSVKYPHRHDFFEVLFLKKGSGYHVIDGNKYEIQPPCVFFMSPGQAHKLELSNDIEGYIFTWERRQLLIQVCQPLFLGQIFVVKIGSLLSKTNRTVVLATPSEALARSRQL